MDSTRKELPKAKQYEGMSQYRPPLNFELVGKSFELVMDDGYDYVLKFLSREKLSTDFNPVREKNSVRLPEGR